ncbi:type II toxin-antitoxin system VapB family antitoxin [Amycolatopsis panacis]|uniref:Protein transcription factor n=1 Tax=Amycolatopsis panacis TaxID=2340917 RepID=A0A419I432_9PSEU|nr:type II toxin-antitoxin system VapB family antitoxin [Amycolatopsis panacis]RJQ85007.1 protein transcription factor [Amycolatopsis panacis]
MAMNIKDPEAERLAAEVAALTGDTKTAAVRTALRELRDKLAANPETAEERLQRLHRFLEEEVWSQLPPDQLGVPITKEEQETILGFGPEGV